MKKVLFGAVVLLAMASCTKDWTCNCKTKLNIGDTSTETKLSYLIKEKERGEAKDICQAANVSSNTITTKCKL